MLYKKILKLLDLWTTDVTEYEIVKYVVTSAAWYEVSRQRVLDTQLAGSGFYLLVIKEND